MKFNIKMARKRPPKNRPLKVEKLTRYLEVPLPEDLHDFLISCSGDSPTEDCNYWQVEGSENSFYVQSFLSVDEIIEYHSNYCFGCELVPFADDVFGNFLVVDISDSSVPVYFFSPSQQWHYGLPKHPDYGELECMDNNLESFISSLKRGNT